VKDGNVLASNIFQRGNEWAFRFTNEGMASEEIGAYEKTDNLIQELFRKNGLNFEKTIYPFKNNRVPSFQYKGAPYRILLTRYLVDSAFYHEVIIYYGM
jgi:hypothetical protein